MDKGCWKLKDLKENFEEIDTCEYNAKEYILYKDDRDNTLILVNITDRWYVYIFDFMLNGMLLINDDSFLQLGDD
jgi:hypothetical protein